MGTTAERDLDLSEPVLLAGVTYQNYLRWSRHPKNRHLRMAYRDGTLEISSPVLFAHEGPSRRFSLLIIMLARTLQKRVEGTGSLSIHRQGSGGKKGVGRVPDQGFYLGSVDRFPRNRTVNLDAGDPPPDLWIEVDDCLSVKGPLSAYAYLGVPEVWQYRVSHRSLQFWGLVDGQYLPLEQSLPLPILTTSRVLEAIGPGQEMIESDFLIFLEGWIPAMIARAANDPLTD